MFICLLKHALPSDDTGLLVSQILHTIVSTWKCNRTYIVIVQQTGELYCGKFPLHCNEVSMFSKDQRGFCKWKVLLFQNFKIFLRKNLFLELECQSVKLHPKQEGLSVEVQLLTCQQVRGREGGGGTVQ